MPPWKPNFDTSLSAPCYEMAAKWLAWKPDTECPFTADDIKEFLPDQIVVIYFLMSFVYQKAVIPLFNINFDNKIAFLNSISRTHKLKG